MKGIFLSGSFVRSLSIATARTAARIGGTVGAAVLKPAPISAAGLMLCLAGAVALAPSFLQGGLSDAADERIAYSLTLTPASDRGADWNKFAAAGNFDGLDVARAVAALGDSKRIVAAFEDMGYRLDMLRGGAGTVPRIYLQTLPADLSDIDSTDLRKAVFIKSMLPPILRVNEEILDLRETLQSFVGALDAGRTLDGDDLALIDETATLYDVKPGERPAMLKELLRRVDIVPPSLALTQAALESGWGTSRFAQEGNALFGQKAFNDTVDSLLARHKKPADAHRYRSYDSLMSAVRSYAHNLNSHPAYGEFRSQRAELRKKAADGPLDGDNLARTLLRYSERGLSYTADLRQMMRSNGMRSYDAARLEATGTQFASRSPSGA
jgi:Bax protein